MNTLVVQGNVSLVIKNRWFDINLTKAHYFLAQRNVNSGLRRCTKVLQKKITRGVSQSRKGSDE